MSRSRIGMIWSWPARSCRHDSGILDSPKQGAGKLATDGAGGVGIVAQVHGAEHGLAEVERVMERPERRLE